MPGSIKDGFSMPSRNRARTTPSQRRWANPSGQTSSSLAVKSVSFADDAAKMSSADRARDLGVFLKRRGGVDQDVVAALDRAIIVGAADLGECRLGDERHGPLGIRRVAIFPFVSPGLAGRKRAVAVEAVGAAMAVKEVLDELGPGGRPLVLVAPGVGPHDEDPDRRLAHHAGVNSLEPVVVPAQHRARKIDLGGGAEVDFPELGGLRQSRCGAKDP